MLDIVKYVRIEAEKYRVKQNSDGTWICIDLKANTIKELEIDIGEVNKVLNQYNDQNKKVKRVVPKKEPVSTMVRGLK